MTLNKNKKITVNMCYELHGHRECLTLNKYEAFNLRNEIEEKKGVVWWFTPIE